MLTMKDLDGYSYDKARLFGLPHIGAKYRGDTSGRQYDYTSDTCAVCGKPATNIHHIVPRGVGTVYHHPSGFILLSPLIALCGSGTTGCHNGFHGGASLKIRWEWIKPEYEALWWSGELLKRYGEHSKKIYRFGYWVISGQGFEKEIRK